VAFGVPDRRGARRDRGRQRLSRRACGRCLGAAARDTGGGPRGDDRLAAEMHTAARAVMEERLIPALLADLASD